MVVTYIGLGSNVGDRALMIQNALAKLAELPSTEFLALSDVTETAPVGPIQNQPRFLNAVVALQTDLEPLDLLDHLLAIEKSLGRERVERWGPRTIDLDILMYGTKTLRHPRLTLPHPEIRNRPFVREALRELNAIKDSDLPD